MNQTLLRRYILEYQKEFQRIHKLEIYKWRAVKQFQDTWDVDAEDFAQMLQLTLSKTHNLMAAAQYWPERMIIANAEKNPNEVRALFKSLFDEELDVFDRIKEFRKGITDLNVRNFPDRKDYQDERAILVYLNLRFPDTYFFYKFKMFKEFCKIMEHDYLPRRGSTSNVAEFFYLCNIVKDEIRRNNELLKLHKGRIGADEYFDGDYNILTQDFVYAVAYHLTTKKKAVHSIKSKLTMKPLNAAVLPKKYQFVGKYVDYIALVKRRKQIGEIGEEIVFEHETHHCHPGFKEKIERVSRTAGDGLGFDILSYDETGNEKYIEVKATTGSVSRPFYITGAELERSRAEGNKFYLYRLYHLNVEKRTADCYIIQGDLSQYCINPTEYEVVLKT